MAKISRKKINEVLRRVAGIDSGPATQLRRGFQQGGFLTTTSKFTSFTRVQNCGLFTAGPQPCTNLVQHRLFFQRSLLRQPGHPNFIPERICGDV